VSNLPVTALSPYWCNFSNKNLLVNKFKRGKNFNPRFDINISAYICQYKIYAFSLFLFFIAIPIAIPAIATAIPIGNFVKSGQITCLYISLPTVIIVT